MTDNGDMTDIKDGEGQNSGPKKRLGRNKLFLIISGGVLLAALIVCAVLLLQTPPVEDNADRVIEFGTVMKGVSVGGIDISGMTKEEALAATATLPAQLLAQVNFTIDVAGEQMAFTAQDFALYTDYDAVIEQAVVYGRTGSFDDRLAAANEAKESGIDFPVDILVDEAGLKTALSTLKTEMDTAPVDATVEFAPWGYTTAQNGDGTVTYTKWEPTLEEIIAICKKYASGKNYEEAPNLVRLSAEEIPLALRYEYWDDRKGSHGAYVENYIPRDADIARFIYTESVDGLILDTDAVFTAVVSQVQSDAYETIAPPVEITPAAVSLDDLKSQTQLIASWSSSYGGSGHYGYNRNYNVAMLSSLLTGAQIEPGEVWSVNDTAGPRNATTAKTYGWREASGIENGGYTPQYGGGVCQLGSTTYNAAIRAGLAWTEHKHHSIPSDYVPLGLDSTLNSPSGNNPGLDLKLRNDAQTAYYLVSYIDPIERNVTVEFYGVPLTDASGQSILLRFTSKNLGRYGSPSSRVIEVKDGFVCPDGTIISSGRDSYQFARSRAGTIVQVYKATLALDGTQIGEPEDYEYWKYPVIDGTTYVLKGDEPTPTTTTEASPSEF
jgi:vancomycin resistance protein YoaR